MSGILDELLSKQDPKMVRQAKERTDIILEKIKQKEVTSVQKYCRPVWDEYFTNQLPNIALRSTCLRRQIGAIITVDNVIVSTGYNGSPFGFDHCTVCAKDVKGIESGKGQNECYACHSEMNAIAACASSGSSCKGGTIYISVSPCAYCAKLLIQSKIKRIVYVEHYPDVVSFDILNRAGIDVVQFKKGE